MSDSPSIDDRRTMVNRRQVLNVAGASYAALNLPGLLQAQAAAPIAGRALSPIKACIFIFYYGGPSHLDTFDMKPDAPSEVRGEFNSIATSVPGVRVSEHLPMIAAKMHKFAVVRSMNHRMRAHDSASSETLTGRTPPGGDRETIADSPQTFPSHGASLSYCWRAKNLPVCHAALPYVMNNVIRNPGQTPGFLGAAYDPFLITGDARALTYRAEGLQFPVDITRQRLDGREALLNALGREDHVARAVGNIMGEHYEKAFHLLRSEAVRRALDVQREPEEVRARYGMTLDHLPTPEERMARNGAHLEFTRILCGQNLLLARRLVEAGVPFVNVYDYRQQGRNWDAHADGFKQHKHYLLPQFDRGLVALVDDLESRGLLDSTLVVGVGEFGRTPKINKNGGRDHWPDCYSLLLAGGGVHGGALYGSSDKLGMYPATNPASPADLAATIFWRFGLDPATEVHDRLGRPFKIADGEPICSLF